MSRSKYIRRAKERPAALSVQPQPAPATAPAPPAPEPTPPGSLRMGYYVIGEGLHANVSGHPGIRY